MSLGPWRRFGCDDDEPDDGGIIDSIPAWGWALAGLATAACSAVAAYYALREQQCKASAAALRLALEERVVLSDEDCDEDSDSD